MGYMCCKYIELGIHFWVQVQIPNDFLNPNHLALLFSITFIGDPFPIVGSLFFPIWPTTGFLFAKGFTPKLIKYLCAYKVISHAFLSNVNNGCFLTYIDINHNVSYIPKVLGYIFESY